MDYVIIHKGNKNAFLTFDSKMTNDIDRGLKFTNRYDAERWIEEVDLYASKTHDLHVYDGLEVMRIN